MHGFVDGSCFAGLRSVNELQGWWETGTCGGQATSGHQLVGQAQRAACAACVDKMEPLHSACLQQGYIIDKQSSVWTGHTTERGSLEGT